MTMVLDTLPNFQHTHIMYAVLVGNHLNSFIFILFLTYVLCDLYHRSYPRSSADSSPDRGTDTTYAGVV